MSGADPACTGDRPLSGAGGSIMILVLVFLSLMAGLSVSLLSASTLQLRLASNFHARESLLMTAAAVAEAVTGHETVFDLSMEVDETRCLDNDSSQRCSAVALDVPAALVAVPARVQLSVRVRRKSPLVVNQLSGREHTDTSAVGERFGIFEVEVGAVDSAFGGAGATVVRGVAVRYPDPPGGPSVPPGETRNPGSIPTEATRVHRLYWTERGVDAL